MVHAFVIEPLAYVAFEGEAEQLDKCREWGLLSEKASKIKTFYYKGNGLNEACSIVGYVDRLTAVIAFENGQTHCIHPAYLKEMQAASFGQKFAARADADAEADTEADALAEAEAEAGSAAEAAAEAPHVREAVAAETPRSAEEAAAAPAVKAEPAATPDEPSAAKAKGKAKKVELPEAKVRMTATVKAFTTVPNHFSDNDDEVVVYEAVSIADPAIELGEAWSSYSATIKKLELAVGDTIDFEAKVIAKKLTKHPVAYKINNPAKIAKREG